MSTGLAVGYVRRVLPVTSPGEWIGLPRRVKHVSGSPFPIQATPAPRSETLALPPAGETDDTLVPRDLVPPPAGRKDRKAARVSRILAVAWAIYLVAFFVLPQRYVHQPTLRVLDVVLWPIARTLGKPAVVAVVAVGVAVLTLLVQKSATDNRRLREAKRRAAELKRRVRSFPEGTPEAGGPDASDSPSAASNAGGGVDSGWLVAGADGVAVRLVPGACRSGGMERSGRLGGTDCRDWWIAIGASRSESRCRRRLSVDDSTPPSRTLPPLRATLEHLLVLYRQPRDDPAEPWELKLAPDLGREQTANDLQAYLEAGIPPQGITWLLRPPEDMSGRFSVTVTAGAHPPVSLFVTLGDNVPPTPRLCHGSGRLAGQGTARDLSEAQAGAGVLAAAGVSGRTGRPPSTSDGCGSTSSFIFRPWFWPGRRSGWRKWGFPPSWERAHDLAACIMSSLIGQSRCQVLFFKISSLDGKKMRVFIGA